MADQDQHSATGDSTVVANENTATPEPAVEDDEFEKLAKRSDAFLEDTNLKCYPTTANTLRELGKTPEDKQKILSHAEGSSIIVHHCLRSLIADFLDAKRQHGTEKEKALYANLDVNSFVRRTIIKRPLVFFTGHDITLLRNGQSPSPKDWKKVGKDVEGDITLDEYMTYDEIQISALVGTSVPTFFINSGDRRNSGQPGREGSFVVEGIYIGLTGARFEKPDCMESCHVLISDANTEATGYGKNPTADEQTNALLKLWAKFYKHSPHGDGEYYFPTFTEVQQLLEEDPKTYSEVYYSHKPSKWVDQKFINIPVYKSRLFASILPFLKEANDRAHKAGKTAYCHVVGLGLGVWQVANIQARYMLEVYEYILEEYELPCVSDINFSWFPDEFQELPNGIRNQLWKTERSNNKVNMIFSKRDPAAPLPKEDQDKLLVAMYAWDGNSFPGNEYWRGMLGASGDPAAACCSTIPELQNPMVNTKLVENNITYWGDDDLLKTVITKNPKKEEVGEMEEEDKEEVTGEATAPTATTTATEDMVEEGKEEDKTDKVTGNDNETKAEETAATGAALATTGEEEKEAEGEGQ